VRNTLVDEEEIISVEGDPLLNLGFQLPEVVKNYADLNLINKDIGLEAKKAETSENLNVDVLPSFSAEYIEAEMNFPARLIHLKIENDKVKNEMVELENLMSNGI
jgi:hypothetical protein